MTPPSKIAASTPPPLPCGRALPAPDHAPGADTEALLGLMMKRLETYVTAKSLNRSEAREKILETIVREARHFRAQDLLAPLGARYPEVGRATLYRNLPVLVESGILQEGPTDEEGQTFYELSDEDHHDHIVCLDCRHIFEFHDEAIEKRQDAVATKLGFHPRTHRHVIYAECQFLKKSRAK